VLPGEEGGRERGSEGEEGRRDGGSQMEDRLRSQHESFPGAKRYPTLTVEILKGIPDPELEQALIDFVDCKVEESGKPEREVIDMLSPGFRAVVSTWIVEGEVNNGGFNQFFWNPSREHAEVALAGFDLLGAKDYAQLMRRAIAINDADQAKMKRFKNRGRSRSPTKRIA
jgi:hypothetical protein